MATATKQLTATAKLNSSQMEKKLKNIAKAIDIINRSVGRQTRAYNQVNQALRTSVKNTNDAKRATDNWSNSADKVNKNLQKNKSALSSIGTMVKAIASTYLGMKTVKLGINTSDKITSTENRLNNLEGATPELTAETMDKVYAAAQRARTGYTGMLSNVSKTMTLAGDSFQGNIDNAIRFQEIMAKAYTVGGASATEASTSMYQLVQALGSGTLAGDELRSVREGAPLAYKAIEEFAQKAFNTKDSLKDLASQGVITSDIVVAAIMDMENGADNINDKFKNTEMTFSQAWEKIKNMTTRAFQPALQALNDALNNPKVQKGIAMLGQGLTMVGQLLSGIFSVVSGMFEVIGSLFEWVSNNWSWLSQVLVILGVAMAVILFPKFVAWISYLAWVVLYYTWVGVTAVAAGIKAAIAWAIANWQLLLIIVAIVAVIAALSWLCGGFSEAMGVIVGVVVSALAIIWNIVAGVINAIIQTIWSIFVEPIAGLIEWIVNAFNGGFNNIGDAFFNLCGQLLSTLIGLAKPFASIIDTLFGTSLKSKINEAQSALKSWGKNENAVTFKVAEAPQLGRIAVSDAYNAGYEWGYNFGEAIQGFGLPSIDDPSLALGDSYDPSGANDDILKGLDELNGTTKDIDNKMDLTDNDLEYLRKIAEMEWRNEFTTAEIKVDMTNNNTVSGERDLDGIVSYLAEALREEMTNVAYGVHY